MGRRGSGKGGRGRRDGTENNFPRPGATSLGILAGRSGSQRAFLEAVEAPEVVQQRQPASSFPFPRGIPAPCAHPLRAETPLAKQRERGGAWRAAPLETESEEEEEEGKVDEIASAAALRTKASSGCFLHLPPQV